ncbi:SAM-dependent methyltransferase [Bartonella sp. TP]|uniref:class I SAM-dependent DNA methyltransferase n=1 Tax=Bartonella sp. TP TaxID=3057550 RepID=UPI0025B15DDA|nr:SAM-dependent methyltransferase [Bartonella sp. TP]WJW80162.1 SAM-dependent methyltransferase [Bartonella sp. TP]
MKDRFDLLYENSFDPWDYLTSRYEEEKYLTSLKTLPKQNYNRILELGCSIGVFTDKLASMAKSVYAIDSSTLALKRAKHICSKHNNIHFIQTKIPYNMPKLLYKKFDLIILSEFLYYLTPEELQKLAYFIAQCLTSSAHLLLVSYSLPIDEQIQGPQAAEYFCSFLAATNKVSFRQEIYKRKNYQINLLICKKLCKKLTIL